MNELLNKIENLYDTSLQEHGVDSKSVGWENHDLHQLRFKKLVSQIDNKTEITVNDLGCGYGAMYNYLNEKFKLKTYYGYDISEHMLDKAREHIKDKKCEWICNSKLNTVADYTFISGIFNVKFDTNIEEWTKYILSVLDNVNEYSSKGFSFNLLTSYVDYKKEHLYYGDPTFFFDYCKKNYSKKVALLHDYELWEWTIIVYKD